MRLTQGKSRYKLPNSYVEIVSVVVKHKNINYYLTSRPLDFGLPTLKKGFPTSFSIAFNQIEFYPIPDKDYYAEIQYTVMKVK